MRALEGARCLKYVFPLKFQKYFQNYIYHLQFCYYMCSQCYSLLHIFRGQKMPLQRAVHRQCKVYLNLSAVEALTFPGNLLDRETFLRVILSVIQRCYLSIARQYSKGEIESTGDKHSSNFWRETQRHSLYYMVLLG